MRTSTLSRLTGGIGGAWLGLMSFTTGALAQVEGQPTPGGIGLPAMVTPVGHEAQVFYNDVLLPIITIIPIFVLFLLVYVMWRFNEKANPVAVKDHHNITLEVVWTVIPCLILLGMAFPSMRLLTHQVEVPEAAVTIKVTGNQWYWKYEYPQDQGGGFSFEQHGKADNELQPGELRMLAVDNEAIVPVGEVVKVLVTATDVIHAFGIPSFGIRQDAIPGRMNETWFKVEKEGVYYGECYFLCGKDHAYMPIAIRAVSRPEYEKWLAEAKTKFAGGGDGKQHVAANQ